MTTSVEVDYGVRKCCQNKIVVCYFSAFFNRYCACCIWTLILLCRSSSFSIQFIHAWIENKWVVFLLDSSTKQRMALLDSTWKSNIFSQLKEHNHHWKLYDDIIEHCKWSCLLFFCIINLCLTDNRILDNNTTLQTQCAKLEKDVYQLRLANAGLEKASHAR